MYESRESAYRDVEILSSSPERLILLLYERLLVSLKRAAHAIRTRDVEGKHESLVRARDILCELLGSLDHEKGGALARSLASLYVFWDREIADAGRTLDEARLVRVTGMVAELHESWTQAVSAVERGEVQPAPRGGTA